MVRDTDIVERLFKEHYKVLFLYAKKFLKQDEIASDVLQDVFLRLCQNSASIDPLSIRAYLFKSVRNACLNVLEHDAVVLSYYNDMQRWLLREELNFYASAETSLIEKEESDTLWKFIEALPQVYKDVLKLRLKNFKTKEIAAMQNIPLRTVETNIYRGMKILREKMVASCIAVCMMFL